MNRRVHRTRVSHDRWLVSYADFITLLFAFFVVLFAFAKADEKKAAQVSAAVDTALNALSILPNTSVPASENSQAQSAAERHEFPVDTENFVSSATVRDGLDSLRRQLEQSLSSQIGQRNVTIRMGRDGLVISLREAGFFNSASADPRPDTLGTLRRIADSLGRTPYDIRIEGHTDNVPIHNAEFDSNWELSAARATQIAHIFIDLNAIPPSRLSAAGYAEFHPIASNQTAEGRAENRRVDLVVMPRSRLNFATPESTPSGPWRKITEDH
ncbi:MAG: flagellar motor protein MotB [Terracidiphilus sp.]